LLSILTGGVISTDLLYVWVPLVGLQQCNETGNAGRLDESMLCAGQEGKDTCQVSVLKADMS